MNDLIAKRYVKALLDGRDVKSATAIYDDLKTISLAFSEEKFNSIVASSEVSSDDKVNLVISFVDKCSDDLKNLIKLLGTNKRIDLIPEIVSELEGQISKMNNTYTGVVYTNKKLTAKYVSSIEEQFSKNLMLSYHYHKMFVIMMVSKLILIVLELRFHSQKTDLNHK